MTHVYRCTHDDCRRRVILTRRLERYVRTPKCPGCDRPLTGREDRAVKLQRRRLRCTCDGYHFPHRRGSLYCVHATRPLTDADHEARYGRAAA